MLTALIKSFAPGLRGPPLRRCEGASVSDLAGAPARL